MYIYNYRPKGFKDFRRVIEDSKSKSLRVMVLQEMSSFPSLLDRNATHFPTLKINQPHHLLLICLHVHCCIFHAVYQVLYMPSA